jgi:hypothetical protein
MEWNGGVERRRARCVGRIESGEGCAERNATPGEKVLKE